MKYRTKVVVIEAEQLLAGEGARAGLSIVKWIVTTSSQKVHLDQDGLMIETLEGWMRAGWGDFVIRGLAGEFYSCKAEMFALKYEPADPDQSLAYVESVAQSQDPR